ncbi:hypothetical protein [uncultured Caulobacter sp.]|uniref:hypothetical protein n=1 Tax=uncultured Caulobacter sp. TaxID=158749 RepID=UPI002622B3AB|nr:hypothetical protein [uncultured Caulobacter sp.]
MAKSRGLILYLLVALPTAAVGRIGRGWSESALGLPADVWKGFLQAGAVVIPLAVVGGVLLARGIVARAKPEA